MKQLFILICLLISTSTFSQITTDSAGSVSYITQIQQDSIIQTATSTSIMTTKLDSEQTARIDNIERKLSSFYSYNRRYQALTFVSVGLMIVGVISNNGSSNNRSAGIITLAGSAASLAGLIIYIDSYKFLNFKPKVKQVRQLQRNDYFY